MVTLRVRVRVGVRVRVRLRVRSLCMIEPLVELLFSGL